MQGECALLCLQISFRLKFKNIGKQPDDALLSPDGPDYGK